MQQGVFIVADFGKTVAKLTLWTKDGVCLERVTRPNSAARCADYAMLDVNGIGEWLIATLKSFSSHPIESIIPVAHGAAVVGIANREIAFPPLDYEQEISSEIMAQYRDQRDDFAHTGSPALPQGLNIGSQLHWLEMLHGEAFTSATLLPYAQYWAWFLSGALCSEVTSLGCHSDLWSPSENDFSDIAKRRGWAGQFAPMARAGDAIDTLSQAIAKQTGLSPHIRIHAGLHDSNAALVAARGFDEIADNDATVLSTGTWFIAMRGLSQRSAVDLTRLPEAQDCLVNIDVHGRPVPSARFMGGREIETLIEIDTRQVDIVPDQPALIAAVQGVIETGAMLLPTFAPGFGPFPMHKGAWINRPDDWYSRRAAACLYAALVADQALDLIESQDILLIEGRFAEAQVFVRALASLRPKTKIYTANAHNDVSFGALRLLLPHLKPNVQLVQVMPLAHDLGAYKARWLDEINGGRT